MFFFFSLFGRIKNIRILPNAICGLSLLLVLVLATRVFLRVLRFSSRQKDNIFSMRSGCSGSNGHLVDSTEIPINFSITRDGMEWGEPFHFLCHMDCRPPPKFMLSTIMNSAVVFTSLPIIHPCRQARQSGLLPILHPYTPKTLSPIPPSKNIIN